MLSAFHTVSYTVLITCCGSGYHSYPHFSDEETKAKRSSMAFSDQRASEWQNWDSKPGGPAASAVSPTSHPTPLDGKDGAPWMMRNLEIQRILNKWLNCGKTSTCIQASPRAHSLVAASLVSSREPPLVSRLYKLGPVPPTLRGVKVLLAAPSALAKLDQIPCTSKSSLCYLCPEYLPPSIPLYFPLIHAMQHSLPLQSPPW